MFAKTTFALAVIIGSTAGAPAATIHQNPTRGTAHHAVAHRWQVDRQASAPDSIGVPTYGVAAVNASQNRGLGYIYLPGKGIVESCGLPTSYCWETP